MRIRGGLVITAATLAVVSVTVSGASATGTTFESWKGGDSLLLTGLVPNPARCGTPSLRRPVLEARLGGTGIDTAAGAFAVTASACLHLGTLRVTGLVATDTFTAGPHRGDSLSIASDPFTFARNVASGVLHSRHPVGFRVSRATGRLAGTTGRGHYEIALSWPPSGGLPQPAHVWFEGTLRVP